MSPRHLLLSLLLALTLLPVPALAAPWATPRADASQATLTLLEGSATVVDGASGSPRQGTSGDTLVAGDRVITANPGRALLTFFDGSEQELGPDTEVLLSQLGQTDGGGLLVQVAQSSGDTTNRIAQLGQNASYQLQTPNTVSLVRGTRFSTSLTLDPQTHQVTRKDLKVDEGVVEVRLRTQTRKLNPGESLSVVASPGGLEVVGGEPVISSQQQGGGVLAWGRNFEGQLGQGTPAGPFQDKILPVQVGGLGGVVQVAAGQNHALAVTGSGEVWAWAVNNGGQLGPGGADRAQHSIPALVSGVQGVRAVDRGNTHTIVLLP